MKVGDLIRRQEGPPQLRRWPFYGRALQTIKDLPAWPRDELCELEKAIEHRALVEKHLAAALSVARSLEADLAAIDAVWPSEPKRRPAPDQPKEAGHAHA
jgi:hypothetical protein